MTLQDLLHLPSGAHADAEVPMWIAGRPTASVAGSAAALDDISPSTGSVLARVDVEVRYPGLPFGGWKQSGIGKELGLVDDILSYTHSKAVSVAVSPARITASG